MSSRLRSLRHRLGVVLRAATPLEWSCLPVGITLALLYGWILDDAFIYFRYVDNLLFLGIGLVYNAGEFVEGFSSPLWILLLTAARWLCFDYWHCVQLLGIAAFATFWWLLVRLARRAAPPDSPTVNLPLLILTPNYAVLCYFTSGMETPLVQVLAVAYALYVLDPESRPLQVALALAPLVRHELLLPWVIGVAWAWLRSRRAPVFLLTSTALALGTWLAFRVFYYADLLPNTFYLKSVSAPEQGLRYLQDTLLTYHFYPLALLVVALAAYALRRIGPSALRLGERGVMLLAAVAVATYVVSIGGDARHYRYLAFPFILTVCAMSGIVEAALGRLRRTWHPWVPVATAMASLIVLLSYPRQLDRHPLSGKERHRRVARISDASYHRHMQRLEHEAWAREVTAARLLDYRARHPQFVYEGVDAGFWCVGMYRGFNLRQINSLGLTDPLLARVDVPVLRPGHKRGLRRLAGDLTPLAADPRGITVETVRAAAARGAAPPWIAANLPSIEVILRKASNSHRWRENLGLALSFPDRIRLPTEPRPRAGEGRPGRGEGFLR